MLAIRNIRYEAHLPKKRIRKGTRARISCFPKKAGRTLVERTGFDPHVLMMAALCSAARSHAVLHHPQQSKPSAGLCLWCREPAWRLPGTSGPRSAARYMQVACKQEDERSALAGALAARTRWRTRSSNSRNAPLRLHHTVLGLPYYHTPPMCQKHWPHCHTPPFAIHHPPFINATATFTRLVRFPHPSIRSCPSIQPSVWPCTPPPPINSSVGPSIHPSSNQPPTDSLTSLLLRHVHQQIPRIHQQIPPTDSTNGSFRSHPAHRP